MAHRVSALLLGLLTAACASSQGDGGPTSTSSPTAAPVQGAGVTPTAAPTAGAPDPGGAAGTPAPAPDAAPAASVAGPAGGAAAAPTALAPGGRNFGDEARLLHRVLACAGGAALPETVPADVVSKHCAALAPRMESYTARYVVDARAFIAKLRPAGLPTVVVYPFGGGDLTTALITYPELTEVTTISLEHAGDPRTVRAMDRGDLNANLAVLRRTLAGLLQKDNSSTENLMLLQQSDLPGQLSFFLVGLAAHGYEPVDLRFFRLEPDGSLHYYTDEEIAALDRTRSKRLHREYLPPNSSPAFANAELTFRPAGQPAAPLRVHRHFAANLADDYLKKDPALLRHLEGKGKVSAITKAAAYLLWSDGFSAIRDYLLEHMVFMVSDATGIPPRHATRAGFEIEVFGRFQESFLPRSEGMNEEFRHLWASQPYRKLPFRFGYQDSKGNWHMMVTRRPNL